MNKTTFLVCAGLIFAMGESQAHPQAATEYGMAAVASHRIVDHSAITGSIYHHNAMALAHKSSPSGSNVKKSSGHAAEARVIRRGPTQHGRAPDVPPPAQQSTGIQMTIVGAAPQ